MFALHIIAASITLVAPSHNVDINAILDGTLGDMPAMWLATHGALAALNHTTPSLVLRGETPSAPASASAAPANRDKANGAVVGAFVGAALLAPIKIKDAEPGGMLKGICQTLVAGGTGMAAAVVGQEAGKRIYGTNSSAPDFEEGLIPGAFIGGVVGSTVGTALAKSLCEIGVPGFKEFLGDLNALDLDRINSMIDKGLPQILDAVLNDLGVDSARAARFSGQLQQSLHFVHLRGPADAVDYLTRELTRESSQLADALVSGSAGLASPAINAFAGFGAMSGAALGLPPIVPSIVAAASAISSLQSLTGQLASTVDFARTLSSTSGSTAQIQSAAHTLHDGLHQAASDMVANPPARDLTDKAKAAFMRAGTLASGILNTLDRLKPVQPPHHSVVVITASW